jgi:hypothetical protein
MDAKFRNSIVTSIEIASIKVDKNDHKNEQDQTKKIKIDGEVRLVIPAVMSSSPPVKPDTVIYGIGVIFSCSCKQ